MISACSTIPPSKDKTGYLDLLLLGLYVFFLHPCLFKFICQSIRAFLYARFRTFWLEQLNFTSCQAESRLLSHKHWTTLIPLALSQEAEGSRTEVLNPFISVGESGALEFARSRDSNSQDPQVLVVMEVLDIGICSVALSSWRAPILAVTYTS